MYSCLKSLDAWHFHAQFGQKQDVLANAYDCVSRNNALSAELTLKHDECVTQSDRSQLQSLYDTVGGARWFLFTVLDSKAHYVTFNSRV